jgi:molecular chaperone GrpE (heat shock protein)
MKYTACSRISDMYDLQSFLRDSIERRERQIEILQQNVDAVPQSPSAARDRVALREEFINNVVAECFAAGVESVRAIKSAFFHRNEQLHAQAQFHAVSGGEIRTKLRELRGEALCSQDAKESQVAALQASIAQQKRLIETLRSAEMELRRLRDEQNKSGFDSDYTQSVVKDVLPSTDVTELNFQAYCADVVQKRLCDDIEPMLHSMRQGLMAVYGPAEIEALKLAKVGEIQHRLFPLDPVTLRSFKENASFYNCDDAKLMWKVMEEELSPEQVQNVFYFATNWHTLSGAPRRVEISFEKRQHKDDLAPLAATCSWSLRMPRCTVNADPNSPESRQRMKKGQCSGIEIVTSFLAASRN